MSFGLILPTALRSGVDLACNRNDSQAYLLADKGGQCIGLTTFPPSSADCLKSWAPQIPDVLSARPGMYREILPSYSWRITLQKKNQEESRNVASIYCVQTLPEHSYYFMSALLMHYTVYNEAQRRFATSVWKYCYRDFGFRVLQVSHLRYLEKFTICTTPRQAHTRSQRNSARWIWMTFMLYTVYRLTYYAFLRKNIKFRKLLLLESWDKRLRNYCAGLGILRQHKKSSRPSFVQLINTHAKWTYKHSRKQDFLGL
jgi:hypothetical protein